jgi:hypothetical protein
MSGLKDRYGEEPDPDYVKRAEFELSVIENMKFVDYFLVVWDLINFGWRSIRKLKRDHFTYIECERALLLQPHLLQECAPARIAVEGAQAHAA